MNANNTIFTTTTILITRVQQGGCDGWVGGVPHPRCTVLVQKDMRNIGRGNMGMSCRGCTEGLGLNVEIQQSKRHEAQGFDRQKALPLPGKRPTTT